MPADSYEDSVKRALGIPTNAELAAQVADEERRKRELEADQPRRAALVEAFNESANVTITRTLKTVQPIAGQAGIVIDDFYMVFPVIQIAVFMAVATASLPYLARGVQRLIEIVCNQQYRFL